MKDIIYLDHAATSFPKPRTVYQSMQKAFESCGGNPGRSSHRLSQNAARAIFECREKVCKLLETNSPERVVFTSNASHALNMAIKGAVSAGNHVVISNLEHNSVIRPLHALMKNGNNISFSFFDAMGETKEEILKAFENAIRKNTKVAVITLASNTCGRILPVKEISVICKKHGILLIADASQALGEIPVSFDEIGADIICAPGHKGLLGPSGTGFMVISDNTNPAKLATLMEGGNGVNSKFFSMPDDLPERFEVGTLNTAGIIGLSAALDFLSTYGIQSIEQNSSFLGTHLHDGLANIEGVSLYGTSGDCARVPVFLFNVRKKSAESVAEELSQKGFCLRSGLHCAPMAHKAFGTDQTGAIRASLGFGNTKSQIDAFLKAVNRISKSV